MGVSKYWVSKKELGACEYWLTDYADYKVIGLSTNLGNPRGFNASGLNELGEELMNELSS